MKTETFQIKVKPQWADRSIGEWFHKEGNKTFTVKQSAEFANFWEVTKGEFKYKTILKEACAKL